MLNLFKTLTALTLVLGLSVAAHAQVVEVTFQETTAGQWDVFAAVTGDTSTTAGISSYSLFVQGVDPADVSYAQNTFLDTITLNGAVGFLPGNLKAEPVDVDFNAGNFQNAGPTANPVLNIGESPVFLASLLPANFTDIDLGVPALLGTFSTDEGLGANNFRAGDFGLFNATGDGFSPTNPQVNTTVIPIPEPTSLALLALGGMTLLARRRAA